ncbi:preprotein translocase subunit SecG [Frigoriflavimonas asaccharolytica]|uniref:Protein-export membrane protein SecG n=1 Tax=Frigoriflavimonas asaccharolytica TaxID=2735899 RepID=A0A8J8G5F7_9FLAO|nr:preprotein translocase subunit SecG [Frigoriflavimonas asaccharolytica]NRS91401.1 preprotein translocase subunit SecG [Frigoriflavimonas asaccharolytica]
MNTIFILFMVLIVIACVLLVIIIMAQNPKGGGLSGTFGGTSPAQFGVQRTNDFMEKSTWTLGGVIIVLCLMSVILTANPALINASTKSKDAAPAKTEAPANSNTPVQAPATK